jgi:hypothetical protein
VVTRSLARVSLRDLFRSWFSATSFPEPPGLGPSSCGGFGARLGLQHGVVVGSLSEIGVQPWPERDIPDILARLFGILQFQAQEGGYLYVPGYVNAWWPSPPSSSMARQV